MIKLWWDSARAVQCLTHCLWLLEAVTHVHGPESETIRPLLEAILFCCYCCLFDSERGGWWQQTKLHSP